MIEQRSDDWFKARLGCVTGSVIQDVMAKPTKGKPEAIGRKNLKARLACELMTGKSLEGKYQSWDMKRGIELEPQARIEYELQTNEELESVGFILHPKIPRFGASPDALVGKYGLLELK